MRVITRGIELDSGMWNIYSVDNMFSKRDDLSPDLEWMLQSGQVDDASLIKALVQQYYQRVYQLARSQLTYHEEAQRTAQDIFVQAVIESSSYRGIEPVYEWLEEIASRFLDERVSSLQGQQLLNPKLIQSIDKLHPGGVFSQQDLEHANQGIKEKLQSRKSSSSKKITAQVFGLLGMIIFVFLFIVGSRSYWSPEPSPESSGPPYESSGDQSSDEFQESQQNTNQGDLSQFGGPLTMNSTDEQISERIQSSTQFWDTMWAEVVVTFHGPESYLGPPKQERHQFWIDPQQGGMLVSGPVDGFPNFIERFTSPQEMIILAQAFEEN